MQFFFLSLLFLSSLVLNGCYEAHSNGDDLRCVPTTNNPNIIPDKSAKFPGVGY